MRIYFDTSALLPLVLTETHSEAMRCAWPNFTERWAWSWLVVEAEAALVRQKADADAWAEWSRVARSLTLVELNPRDHSALRAFNCGLRMRAIFSSLIALAGSWMACNWSPSTAK